MTIKEIQAKAGSMASYVGYILIIFCWSFLDYRLDSINTNLLGAPWMTVVTWLLRMVIAPLLLAGVFGGIYWQQRSQGEWSVGGFWQAIQKYFWRFLAANFLGFVLYVIASVVILAVRGVPANQLGEHKLLAAALAVPYSAIALFWFSAIVVERKIFRGLLRALGMLFLNPFALGIGILWGVINFAMTTGIDFPGGQLALPMDALRAGVLTVARVGAIMYAVAIYTRSLGEAPESFEETPSSESSASGEGWIKASFAFSFVSFVPILHFVALVLGILALKRRKQFVLKAAVACCLGGFFTVFYLLLLAGWLVNRSAASAAPGYAFLTEVQADLKPQVRLLVSGSYLELQQQLEGASANETDRPWAVDTTLALAKAQAGDLGGALENFRLAAKKNPERSEFYYYYGLALLKDGQEKRAAEEFKLALQHGPRLESAQRYADLLDSTYDPSITVSALLYIFILLILFTLHEYGHAYAAWKLGDDTAEKQGRLTLNPIAHLELFGSILLPALLLFQGSEFVFGWARPVPVDVRNLKNPQKDHMLVSFAGPAMNLLISMATLLLLGAVMLVVRLFWPETLALHLAMPFAPISLAGPPFARWLILLVLFLKQLFYTSLVLGCFNLLPIPPLDGSWIISGWLPQGLRVAYEKIRPFGFIIFLLLVMTSVFDYILLVPVTLAWGTLQLLLSAMGLG